MTTLERYRRGACLASIIHRHLSLSAAEIAELNLRFIRNEQDEIQFCNDPGQYQTIKPKAEWLTAPVQHVPATKKASMLSIHLVSASKETRKRDMQATDLVNSFTTCRKSASSIVL
jgi:hypothetical protein